VARQLGQLQHRRVLPDKNLILRVTMRAYQLIGMLRPRQVAHLRARIHRLQILSSQSIPEANTPIRSASARGQQAVLVWRPRDRLHSGNMVVVSLYRRVAAIHIPHEQLIIVASRCQEHMVRRPFQATHFLLVSSQLAFALVGRHTNVSEKNISVTGA